MEVALDGHRIIVKGPKGKLERLLPEKVNVELEGGSVRVAPSDPNDRVSKSMYGLARTLVSNMVQGVQKPYQRSLSVVGVGYRAELKSDALNLQVGLSHEVNVKIPETVSCRVDKLTTIHLESIDKELVGQLAAEIRAYRPCEPYKGKGIMYVGEQIRRKEGKTGS